MVGSPITRSLGCLDSGSHLDLTSQFTPPVLVQVVLDSPNWIADLPDGVSMVHRGEVVPQAIMHARRDRLADLRRLAGVLRVDPTDLEPAKYAIGLDRVLALASMVDRG